MSVFEEENQGYTQQRPAAKKQPWPVRLTMRFGVKSASQANLIILGVIAVLILTSVVVFNSRTTAPETPEVDDFSNADIQDLINRGVNLDNLTPETIQELRDRGIDI